MTTFLFCFIIMLVFANVNAQDTKLEEVKFTKVAEGLSFPEGPAYNYTDRVYFSNCYGNWLGYINEKGCNTFVTAPTAPYNFEKTNGLVVYKDGSVLACEYGKGAILRFTPDGKCDSFVTGYKNSKFNRPNDIALTPEGNIYFTDPKSYDVNKLDGVVYYVDYKTKEIIPAFSGLGFPNGVAVGPCKKYLFVCESAKQRVLRFKINEDHTLSDSAVVVNLPGGDPDGIAFDNMGNLYIAHFGGGKIVVVSPENKIIRTIKAPGKKPSNLEFAGKDLKTLYVTEDETNCIYTMENDISGFKLFYSPIK
ncbi:MAG: SMP-30/gluconolactonase/LRE family protein [bacterium]